MDRADEYNGIAERIVDFYENDSTDMADDVMELPVTAYTDPEQWQREINLIYKRQPLMVALTCEMPKPGDYKAIDMVGVPLLITRGKNGKARAFINSCTHRGTPVCEDGLGNATRFSCPYHGWTFRNDGSLQGVADQHKFGEIDKSTRGLTELACDERIGMIFAILTPGLELDLDDWLGGMMEDMAPFEFENWHFHGTKVLDGANWKIAYDGYLEGYHFAALHPETISKVTLQNLTEFHAFGPHMRVAYGGTNIKNLYEVPKDTWWSMENNGFTFVRTLFPNISIYLDLGLGQIAQLIPGETVSENRTILYYVHPTPPKDEAESKALDETMEFVSGVVRDEDYKINFQIQRGLKANPFDTVVFGRNERGNQFFHKYVDYFLADDESAERPEL